jgi:uncharacterized protein YuzE
MKAQRNLKNIDGLLLTLKIVKVLLNEKIQVYIMKIAYYPDTDSMYIDLSSKSSTESTEVSPGIVLDYDDKGNIVGIDIDNASKKMDLKKLVLSKISVNKQTISA